MDLDAIDALLVDTRKRLGKPEATAAPHEVASEDQAAKPDIIIRDHRTYIPDQPRTRSRLSTNDPHYFTPAEYQARQQAEAITLKKNALEFKKITRDSDVRKGKGDARMLFSPPKTTTRATKGPQRSTKNRYLMIQPVSEGGPAPAKNPAERLADVVGGYIDEPRGTAPGFGNPTYSDDPRFGEFTSQLQSITGVPFSSDGPYSPRQFGEAYNPEEYRGVRFLLPESFSKAARPGYTVPGFSPPGETVPGYDALNQEFRGHMITRGYPVYGGTGQLPGYPEGFNPVGFGQRDVPVGAGALVPRR